MTRAGSTARAETADARAACSPTAPDRAVGGARLAGEPGRDARRIRPLLLAPDDDAWRAFVADVMGHGPAEAALLAALPAAAAMLGAEWMGDLVSMVDVTIGSARIEGALRTLGAAAERAATGPTVPILLPPWEQHSLPAGLAAHRLCVAGRHAVVLPGLRPEVAVRLPVLRAAPAILVSCVDRPAWSRLDEYLRRLLAGLTTATPLILGGPGFGGPGARPVLPGGARIAADPILALRAVGLYVGDGASSQPA